MQRLHAELSDALGTSRSLRLPYADLSSDPEVWGKEIRQLLGINVEDQLAWPDAYEALRSWRSVTEALGVLVLQLSMPVVEARGFSLSNGPVPTVVVSSSDAIVARIFTLFHELAHLLLATGGLCVPDPSLFVEPDIRIEKFCNHFAGAVLVPLGMLREYGGLRQLPVAFNETDELLADTARKFKTSRYVILRRLMIAGDVTSDQYRQIVERWGAAEPPRPKEAGGGQRPASRSLNQLGTGFVSLVVEAHDRGLITSSDVSDYLSLKLKYLPEVQKLLAAQMRG